MYIDTITNLVELTPIDSKASDIIAKKLEQTWIAWYPRAIQVVDDNDGEFMGYTYIFTCLLRMLEINDVLMTTKNPKSNVICKQMQQTLAMMLDSF